MKKGVLFFLGVLSFFSVSIVAVSKEEEVSLKADNLSYEESIHQAVASSNVFLSYHDIDIRSSMLRLDTVTNQVWASGNVDIRRGGDSFRAASLYYDLNKNRMLLKNIEMMIVPSENKSTMYVKAQEIEDFSNYQVGRHVKMTSCSIKENPHYYMMGEQFDYFADQRIIGHNVFIYSPIFFVPFGFWTPYYQYELGKRSIIWNVPTIGKKETPGWGWYIQNTIDYDWVNGKSSSVFVDLFEKKGVGLGVKHQYTLSDHKGSLGYYRLDEQDTGVKNEKISWQDSFRWTDPLTVSIDFNKIDAQRINSSGRQKEESQKVSGVYNNLGDEYKWNLSHNDNTNQQFKSLSFDINHTFNLEDQYKLTVAQQENEVANLKDFSAVYGQLFRLPEKTSLGVNLNLKKREDLSDIKPMDSTLESNLVFKRNLAPEWDLKIKTDYLFDLQGSAATSNLQNRNYFYRLPEIEIQHNPSWGVWQVKQVFTIARYQEVQYFSQEKKQRVYPESIDFDWTPNTYIFNEKVTRTFDKLPLDSTFSSSLGYNQYIFSTPGQDIWSGDAMYTLDLNLGHTMSLTPFWKVESGYASIYAPAENRSPFLYFSDKTQGQNYVTEKWTFILFDSRYTWSHETGYDWTNERWRDYYTRLALNPVPALKMNVSSGKKLSPTSLDFHQDYFPTVFNTEFFPTQNRLIQATYSLSLDTNKWMYDKKILIQNSGFMVKFPLGDDPDYRWEVGLTFNYNNSDMSEGFDPRRYEMQTLNLIKKEHCRTIAIGYNKASEEFIFKFTIDAYPEDPLILAKTRDVWRLGGRLNQGTVERF